MQLFSASSWVVPKLTASMAFFIIHLSHSSLSCKRKQAGQIGILHTRHVLLNTPSQAARNSQPHCKLPYSNARQARAVSHSARLPVRDISFLSPKKPIRIFTGRSSGFASSHRAPSQLAPMDMALNSASQQRSCRRLSLRSLFTGAHPVGCADTCEYPIFTFSTFILSHDLLFAKRYVMFSREFNMARRRRRVHHLILMIVQRGEIKDSFPVLILIRFLFLWQKGIPLRFLT